MCDVMRWFRVGIILLFLSIQSFAGEFDPPQLTVKNLFEEVLPFSEHEGWVVRGAQSLVLWPRKHGYQEALRAIVAQDRPITVPLAYFRPVLVTRDPKYSEFFNEFPASDLAEFHETHFCYKYVFFPERVLGEGTSSEEKKPLFVFLVKKIPEEGISNVIFNPPLPSLGAASLIAEKTKWQKNIEVQVIPETVLASVRAGRQASLVTDAGRKVEVFLTIPKVTPIEAASLFLDVKSHPTLTSYLKKSVTAEELSESSFWVKYVTSLPGIPHFLDAEIYASIQVSSDALKTSYLFQIESENMPFFYSYSGRVQFLPFEGGTLMHFTSLLVPTQLKWMYFRLPKDLHSRVIEEIATKLYLRATEIEKKDARMFHPYVEWLSAITP